MVADSTTWKSWNIDVLVQGWLDGSIINDGILLKDTDEETLVNSFTTFYTSDYATDANIRPKLEIDYYLP